MKFIKICIFLYGDKKGRYHFFMESLRFTTYVLIQKSLEEKISFLFTNEN